MNNNPYNITEKDLAIFPPKFSYFIGSTLCLMVAHGLSMSIASFYFLQLPPKWLVVFVLGTGPLFVMFNFRVIRGHSGGILFLKILAAIYLLVGLIALIDIADQQINTTFSATTCVFGAAALLILFSNRVSYFRTVR